jgi:hypothetical protein
MKKIIIIKPGDSIILKVRGGGVAIPEDHGFRLYAEIGGTVNLTSERCHTYCTVTRETLGHCLKAHDDPAFSRIPQH